MKAISEQLSELSDRSKKTEDVVAAAREKNRATLESQRVALKTAVAADGAKVSELAADAKEGVRAEWSDTRSSVEQRFTAMRADADRRRSERGVRKAQHHADVAEQDAADAIDLALYVLDQAEYAIVDAAIARADADDLALNS